MITSITIENFKGIGQRVTIPLKPLTLLFGPNSAGKSTILHAIHYAREILERRNLDADRTISGGDFVDLGGFANFVNAHDIGKRVLIRIEFSLAESEFLPDLEPRFDDRSVRNILIDHFDDIESGWIEFAVAYSRERGPYVQTYAVGLDGVPVAAIIASPGSKGALLSVNKHHPNFNVSGREGRIFSLGELCEDVFGEGIRADDALSLPIEKDRDALPTLDRRLSCPTLFDEDENKSDIAAGEAVISVLSRAIVAPGLLVRQMLSSFRYLGPLRVTPPRNYAPPRFPDPSRWACGLGAWDRLIELGPEFTRKVNQWLAGTEEMDCGYRLHVSDITELPSDHELTVALRTQRLEELENASAKLSTLATMKRITIVKEAGGITLMPHDIGVGLSQVIPVLVSALDGGNGLVGMEQPEIHLHPNGQAALGDIFIAGAIDSAGPRNLMIIETHSEHLILRLLRRIRETARGQAFRDTRVTPGDIGVWFVSSEDGETSVIEMGVSEQGEFLRPWPDTFFSQDFFERTA